MVRTGLTGQVHQEWEGDPLQHWQALLHGRALGQKWSLHFLCEFTSDMELDVMIAIFGIGDGIGCDGNPQVSLLQRVRMVPPLHHECPSPENYISNLTRIPDDFYLRMIRAWSWGFSHVSYFQIQYIFKWFMAKERYSYGLHLVHGKHSKNCSLCCKIWCQNLQLWVVDFYCNAGTQLKYIPDRKTENEAKYVKLQTTLLLQPREFLGHKNTTKDMDTGKVNCLGYFGLRVDEDKVWEAGGGTIPPNTWFHYHIQPTHWRNNI